jgi:hypothetical protein
LASCCECADEPSGSGATELVNLLVMTRRAEYVSCMGDTRNTYEILVRISGAKNLLGELDVNGSITIKLPHMNRV